MKLTEEQKELIRKIAESAKQDGACHSGVSELLNLETLPEVIELIKFKRADWIISNNRTKEATIEFLKTLDDYWRLGIAVDIGGIPATAGNRGTATAGYRGTATAGDEGTLIWKYYDGERPRLHIEYIGENGIKPNTPYYGEFNNGVFTVTEKA